MRVPRTVSCRRVNDRQIVLLKEETGEFFALTDVAAEVFHRLKGGDAVADTVSALAGMYDVSRAVLEADVLALIRQFVDANLLEEDEGCEA